MSNYNERVVRAKQQAQTTQPQLRLEQATFIECSNCKSNVMQSLSVFMKFSKILAGTPDDIIQPIPVIVCSDCGTIQEELLPEDFKGKIFNEQSIADKPVVVGNINDDNSKVDDNGNTTSDKPQNDLLINDRTSGGKPLIIG